MRLPCNVPSSQKFCLGGQHGTITEIGAMLRSLSFSWNDMCRPISNLGLFWSCPSTFLVLKVQLVVLVSAFVMGDTVWSVSCLLFFYLRCPLCPAICESRGHVPRALWSRRHWFQDETTNNNPPTIFRSSAATMQRPECGSPPSGTRRLVPQAWCAPQSHNVPHIIRGKVL